MTRGLRIDITRADQLTFGKTHLRAVIRKAANEIAADTRALIRAKVGGGRSYRKPVRSKVNGNVVWKHYTGSKPGNPPGMVSGKLARAVKVKIWRNADGASIRDTEVYAKFLETGARGGFAGRGAPKRVHRAGQAPIGIRVVLPRPFLSLALDRKRASIGTRLKAALLQDVAWKKP